MLNHISIGVRDLARARRFYAATLEPLGYGCQSESSDTLGFGTDNAIDFWIMRVTRPVPADIESGLHICFTAPNENAVNSFHEAALRSGGIDNGRPGPRPDYGDHYYAAFVFDPEGYRLEAYYGGAPG